MDIEILGQRPLKGEVRISGAKNSALKLICASLLLDGVTVLSNVPKSGEVLRFVDLVNSLGARALFENDGSLVLDPSGLSLLKIEKEFSDIRATILLAPILLARFQKAEIPLNRIYKYDQHLNVLKSFGVQITESNNWCVLTCPELKGSEISFEKNTHTGTDLALLLSVVSIGESTILNSAEEPEVSDLISFLKGAGANITRNVDNPRIIKSIPSRKMSGLRYTVMPDRNEAVFFICASIVSDGDLIIKGLNCGHLTSFLAKVGQIGVSYEVVSKEELKVWGGLEKSSTISFSLESKPYPGFMSDWVPCLSSILAICSGESVIKDEIFPQRLSFAKELNLMGGNIEISDERLIIKGPAKLKGAKVEAFDLMSGAALVVAGLGAKGKTKILNADMLDCGFENLIPKLLSLGAEIKKI